MPCRLCTNKNGGAEVCRPLSWFVLEQTRANGWNAISKGHDLCCHICTRDKTRQLLDAFSMLCQSCNRVLRKKEFATEQQKAWAELKDGPFLCNTCEGRKVHRADIDLHYCHGACQRRWPEGAFNPERLAAWIRNNEMGTARCIRCLAMEANDVGLTKEHQCWQCTTSKTLRHYSPIVFEGTLDG